MDTTERFINELVLINLSPLFPERDFSNGVLRGFIFIGDKNEIIGSRVSKLSFGN